MNSVQQIKQRWYVFGVVLITATLLFSTYLPATGRPSSQEGISQPMAFTSNGTLNFQGQLTDQGGNPLNGSFNMGFAIFDSASGGTKKWPSTMFEHHTGVTVSTGLFSVQLGSVGTAITPNIFNEGGDRYLQVWVCKTAGIGCMDYDDMGRLEISSSAIAQTLLAPAVLETTGTGITITAKTDSGTGVFGWATDTAFNNIGVTGRADGTLGFGVSGIASSSTGENHGVRGVSQSTSGYGVTGLALANSGTTMGVRGLSFSPTGRGVFGEATAGSGTNYGIYGISQSTSGVGVFGRANTTNGTNYGVYGLTESATGYAGYFVNTKLGNAGYFVGNVGINGTLSKQAGSFKIDHPIDPENKYLYHSFVESPDMKNIYDGVVILDENGEALVTMPEWFEALNQDFRYQLTALGAAMPNLHISQKVLGNSFRIAGGEPGMEVSWQVTGIRQDPYAVENRIPIEEDKPQDEIGTFLYPQGYGLPEEFSVNYNPETMAGLEALTVNE